MLLDEKRRKINAETRVEIIIYDPYLPPRKKIFMFFFSMTHLRDFILFQLTIKALNLGRLFALGDNNTIHIGIPY